MPLNFAYYFNAKKYIKTQHFTNDKFKWAKS